jgi:hypothetical protein
MNAEIAEIAEVGAEVTTRSTRPACEAGRCAWRVHVHTNADSGLMRSCGRGRAGNAASRRRGERLRDLCVLCVHRSASVTATVLPSIENR